MDIERIKIYRITHIENIPHILEHGVTHRDSPNKNKGYRNIGDLSLIDTRSNREVIIDNGEFDAENNTSIILGDYTLSILESECPCYMLLNMGGILLSKLLNQKI